jgi:HD-GYP domain-containing protein (c-di-GMP phosphodiesterase class II)
MDVTPAESRMQRVKTYVLANFEGIFVVLALLTTAVTNYVLPLKLAFLNFYFLPIILAGYYLGRRRAVLGAVFCVLLVGIFIVLFPESFAQGDRPLDLYAHIPMWGGFLILAGAVVGRLHEKLADELAVGRQLNEELEQRQLQLQQANAELRDYSENLETRVSQRTEELEESKRAVEAMKSKVEDTLYATMDSSVVNMIIEGRLRNEKRTMSVLFADLEGFTSYSEDIPPEVVIRELNRYLGDMEPLLIAYRAHIDKYMGDGIMCEFGAPIDFDTHRLMAVVAGIKMQETAVRQRYPWKMRIGIASGSTITGLIGSKRQTYTAIGNVVNLAARLENLCPSGRVLVDRYTWEEVSRFVEGRKRYDVPAREVHDIERERRLQALHERLAAKEDDADVLMQIGHLHLELGEPVEAFEYLERALKYDPNHIQCKLAYAEASLLLQEHGTISVKGKRKRVEAYEITGLRNPLDDRHKIPARVAADYAHVPGLIAIPNDVILPVEAIDARIGHSTVVAVLSYAIATKLGLPERDRLDVLQAGFMADIGMQIVPHHLLNRRGGFTASEYELVKQHPTEGARLLRSMGYESESLLAIVRSSHEAWDGSGYPEGLRGEAIPQGARIVAVADTYDALTSRRPNREAWARDAALDEIREVGTVGRYDPRVVAALIDLLTAP